MSTVEAAAGKAQAMVRDSVKTVIAASMVGTAIEFYDFYAYGTAAANYFPKVFFGDTTNPTVALLASLLTFAIAFIARPLGSLVFGHFGDRMGRKTTLVVSLMTMGVGTFLIGCLPTYDQVGVGAVAILCLLRFIQGIGLGGEWSGAALVATENAPEDKRALYGSFPELGAPIGFFLSNGTYFVLESFNNQDAMLAWGWRVPFLLAGPLGLIVLYIRAKLADSPVYQSMNDALESKGAASADGQIAAKSGMFAPLAELFHNHLKALIISFGACVLNAVGFYTVLTYLPTYLSDTVGMDAPSPAPSPPSAWSPTCSWCSAWATSPTNSAARRCSSALAWRSSSSPFLPSSSSTPPSSGPCCWLSWQCAPP